jgi:hypothetical protein
MLAQFADGGLDGGLVHQGRLGNFEQQVFGGKAGLFIEASIPRAVSRYSIAGLCPTVTAWIGCMSGCPSLR